MTNREYYCGLPAVILAEAICMNMKDTYGCELCPFGKIKPEWDNRNCVYWWLIQEHEGTAYDRSIAPVLEHLKKEKQDDTETSNSQSS